MTSDGRPLVLINAIHSKTGGGLVYLDEVVPRLSRQDPPLRYVVLARPGQRARLEARGCEVRVVRAPEGTLGAQAWDQAVLPALAARAGAALVFTPANFGPWLLGRRSMILLRNTWEAAGARDPRLRLYWAVLRELTRVSILASGGGMVVSSAFGRHLADDLGIDARRLAVVPHGVDSAFTPRGPRESPDAPPGPYLLVVSDVYPHKNLLRVVEAFARVAAGRPGLTLLVVGRELDPRHAAQLREEVGRRGLEGAVRWAGGRPIGDLPPLYRGAAAALLVSTAETFGITQLEALACGSPLVASDRPFAREVAGDAAVFVEPTDPRAIAEGVLRVLDDPGLAASLRARGPQRAAGFTWERTAERTHRAILDRLGGLS